MAARRRPGVPRDYIGGFPEQGYGPRGGGYSRKTAKEPTGLSTISEAISKAATNPWLTGLQALLASNPTNLGEQELSDWREDFRKEQEKVRLQRQMDRALDQSIVPPNLSIKLTDKEIEWLNPDPYAWDELLEYVPSLEIRGKDLYLDEDDLSDFSDYLEEMRGRELKGAGGEGAHKIPPRLRNINWEGEAPWTGAQQIIRKLYESDKGRDEPPSTGKRQSEDKKIKKFRKELRRVPLGSYVTTPRQGGGSVMMRNPYGYPPKAI